ncbi:MAG: DUF4294 domain-containing protein [Flavobacteriaceae bacterium]
MKQILYLYILVVSANLIAQNDSLKYKDSLQKEAFLIKGDSLYNDAINLDDVMVLKRIQFSNNKDRIAYLILRRKTRKVYPYAKLASEKLTELNDNLQHIKGKRKQKKYTKRIQKYIEEEFSAKLKKLTRTEGQILIKLIHRQTGVTAFELVKELRSGWRAFWYNSTASMFDISLKEEYNPENNKEDYYIEDILMRSFLDQILERQAHKLDFDYYELSDKWINN